MTKQQVQELDSNRRGFDAKRNELPPLFRPEAHRIFFVHIMKTGGASLTKMMRKFCSQHEMYPNQVGKGSFGSYSSVQQAREFDAKAKERLRYIRGHLPYCVRELFPEPIFCVSIFRDPVARTLSNLKQARSRNSKYRGWPLIKIYENQEFFSHCLDNIQTRCFAHELSDDLKSVFTPKDLTASDVARAHERISQLDFIGLLEDYENTIRSLMSRLGLPLNKIARWRFQNEDCEIPPSLPDRIANDNAHDMETYELVRKLYHERQREAQQRAA
jgi:hypothetical protein